MKAATGKRQLQPRPAAVPTGNVRNDRRDEITERYPELLLAIESALLKTRSEASGVDDHWVHQGLVGAMRDDPPDHPCSWLVFEELKKLGKPWSDVDHEDWRDALRVVDQAVRTRFSLKQGERTQLSFTAAFVAEGLHLDRR